MKKRIKLTLEEWFMKLFGFGYVVNHNTREIHKLKCKQHNCQLQEMKEEEFITEIHAFVLIAEEGYNGCCWCWPAQNKE